MIADELGISYDEARQRLLAAGSVDVVLKQKVTQQPAVSASDGTAEVRR